MKLRIVLVMGIALLCAAGAVALYYGLEVRAARRDTAALVSAAWQRYGKRVSLAELSPAREALLLAVEDPAFYRHHGVDLETPGAGMTTITQALVNQAELMLLQRARPCLSCVRCVSLSSRRP